MGFINRYDYTGLTFDNKNKKEVFAHGVQMLIRHLHHAFSEDDRFDMIIIDTLVRGRFGTDFPEILNPSFVGSLCSDNGIDMLLTLDAFNTYFITETEVEEDDDGSKSRTNYVDLLIDAGFTLYGSSGEVIDRSMLGESIFYQTRPALSSVIVFGPSMGKAEEEVAILTEKIGRRYIQNFYPSNEIVTNLIYTGKDFAAAVKHMQNQQWAEAERILFPLAESPDRKLARKAAHNLAVTYEAMGDHERYKYWITRSGK
jgi:hypothetical protein